MSFTPFDPLEFKNTRVTDAAIGALKREIDNILSSYVGWYDPFCELIQNALDAVDARMIHEKSSGSGSSYKPRIDVLINIDDNALTVTDNGIGLDKDKFQQFLAPNFSFKSGDTRGHKGVGATYVAYGFNYMKISTITPGFSACGVIVGARNWLKSNTTGGNPKVEPDVFTNPKAAAHEIDRGVSITVRFDDNTHPKRLDWIRADTAEKWLKILSIKTGIGAINPNNEIEVAVKCIVSGVETSSAVQGISYFWLNTQASKKASFRSLIKEQDALYKKYGAGRQMPDKYRNLDFIYETWNSIELAELLGAALDEEELEVIANHSPSISVEFGYTAKLWTIFNEKLSLRASYKVLSSGIQLAANNMPQGETIQIPLNRNIGRQNQLHFLVHFDKYTPDLGRKGFHRELTDFAKNIAKKITESHLSKLRSSLKQNTGIAPDLVREIQISDWKKSMLAHELNQPLELTSQHFFLPIERISITSTPTREQDVIALFHQLIAGGVIRGLAIMSTNERFTYDGLFKITFDLDYSFYVFDQEKNPLGIPPDLAIDMKGRVTEPKVLEYKFCLDGLIEDLDNQDKNINDIDLCIVWTTGDLYKERYGVTSFLLPENADQRQYHGVTHRLNDLETGAKNCDLIILSELIAYLNDQTETACKQRLKYD